MLAISNIFSIFHIELQGLYLFLIGNLRKLQKNPINLEFQWLFRKEMPQWIRFNSKTKQSFVYVDALCDFSGVIAVKITQPFSNTTKYMKRKQK